MYYIEQGSHVYYLPAVSVTYYEQYTLQPDYYWTNTYTQSGYDERTSQAYYSQQQ